MPDSDFLAQIWLFADLPRESLDNLAPFVFIKSYSPGEIIIQVGRTGNNVYSITSGQVEVVKGLDSENPQQLAVLGEGELFGEMALLDDWPRSASIRALEDTTCVSIDRWLFLDQLRKNPELAIAMLQVLAQRLRVTTTGGDE